MKIKTVRPSSNVKACVSCLDIVVIADPLCRDEFMLMHKKETPSRAVGWLGPKLLTFLRLAQITDGSEKGEEGEEEGEAISVLSDGKHTCQTEFITCVQIMNSALRHITY